MKKVKIQTMLGDIIVRLYDEPPFTVTTSSN